MNWTQFIILAEEVGVNVATWLANKYGPKPVTTAELQELQALCQQDARSELLKALAACGVASDSPQALALLALIP